MTAPVDRSRPRLLVLTPHEAVPAAARILSALAESYDLQIERVADPAPASRPSGLARAFLAFDRRRIGGTPLSAPAGSLASHSGGAPAGLAPPVLAISLAGPDAAGDAARRTPAGCLHVEAADTSPGVLGFRAVLRGASILETGIVHVYPDGRRERRAGHRSRVHPRSPSRTEAWHLARLPRTVAGVVARTLTPEHTEPSKGPTDPESPWRDGPGHVARRSGRAERGSVWPTRPPGTREALSILPRLAARRVADTVNDRLRHRHWCLGLAWEDEALERLVAGEGPGEVDVLVPPPDRFWADPFPVAHGGAHTILFEEWIYAERKARIACITLRPGEPPTAPRTVLETSHHLSYPFVFEWDGAWHLMPEATASGELTIYRSVSFPDVWEPVGTVLGSEGDLGATIADATLHREGATWWLFGARQPVDPGGRDEDLHLFRSDSPFGPWAPHPANPVVSDPSGARPAGPLFRTSAGLVRPAQDCAARYGHRISLRRVTTLSADRYREVPIGMIEPTWTPGLTRTHTLGSCPGLVVLDGSRDRWGPRPPH